MAPHHALVEAYYVGTFRGNASHSFKFSQRAPLPRFSVIGDFSCSSTFLFKKHFPAHPHPESDLGCLAVGDVRELASRSPSKTHLRLSENLPASLFSRQERTPSTFQFLQLNCSLHHGRFPNSEGQSRGCVFTAGHSAHQSNQIDCSNVYLHATSLALFCEVRRDFLFLPREDGKGHEENVDFSN